METQVSASEALQPQPSAYMGTPPLPPNALERIPEDQATHDVALSPQDLFSGKHTASVHMALSGLAALHRGQHSVAPENKQGVESWNSTASPAQGPAAKIL